ncbi:MAG: hypothetical protein LE180_03835 [Endomicrobium sp.]|nr:hypothetical protein [Endomicrobium sp.]
MRVQFHNASGCCEAICNVVILQTIKQYGCGAFYGQFKKNPYKIRKWQNDNRHENMKKFSKILKEEKIQQLFSYPRCPKINGYIERYNRTLGKEFINNIWSVIVVPS